MDRSATDVLASLLAAVEHYERIGALTLSDGERFSLTLLLDEAAETIRREDSAANVPH